MTKKKSIKLKDNLYLDTNSIIHNKENLKEKLLLPYLLFENLSGTTKDIMLNDSAANYQYIEIYGGANGISAYQKIYIPNNKHFSIPINYNYATNYIQLLSTYVIQNNNIRVEAEGCGYLSVIGATANFILDKKNYFNIIRVIGYK